MTRHAPAPLAALLTLATCLGGPGCPSTDPAGGDDPPSSSIQVESDEHPDLVLLRYLHVTTATPAPVTVRCAHPDDPTEEHVVESPEGTEHDLVLAGLLADTRYLCIAESPSDEVPAMFEVRTDPLPPTIPSATVTGEGRGYTVTHHQWGLDDDRNIKILVLDPEGRVRWYYELGRNAGDLDVTLLPDGTFLYGGGFAINPAIVTLEHEVLYEAPDPRSGRVYHHHTEQLDDGTLLSLTGDVLEYEGVTMGGTAVEILDPQTDEVVWYWRTQEAVDAGALIPDTEREDPFHVNWVGVEGERVYIELRTTHQIAAIDMQTHEVIWLLGPGGDFELVDEHGEPAPDEDWFYGPHGPEIAWPRILVYDNGWHRPGDDKYSRVVEYEVDEEAMTAAVVWESLDPPWYEPIWGDADWLPGGDVLAVRGHTPKSDAATLDSSQIQHVDHDTGETTWMLEFTENKDCIYRAQHVDGCELFANRKYCPH